MDRLIVFVILVFVSAMFPRVIPAEEAETVKTDAIFERTNPKYIGKLYQMLKVFDKVAKESGVTYWMDGGTLLGAVRHWGNHSLG